MYKSEMGNFVYIRIPKTGSTSLVRALKAKYPDVVRIGVADHKMAWEVPRTTFDGYRIFTVIRNPIDWARSIHQSIMEGITSKQKMIIGIAPSPDPATFVNQLKYTQRDWYAGLVKNPDFTLYPMTGTGLATLSRDWGVELARENVTERPEWYIKSWERALEREPEIFFRHQGLMDDVCDFSMSNQLVMEADCDPV